MYLTYIGTISKKNKCRILKNQIPYLRYDINPYNFRSSTKLKKRNVISKFQKIHYVRLFVDWPARRAPGTGRWAHCCR